MASHSADTPLYSIAVAAELSRLPPATLRLYEEKGLLLPARTDGGTRRYSEADLRRIREVSALQDDGVNLTGIGRVLELQEENKDLRRRLRDGDHEPPAPEGRTASPTEGPPEADRARATRRHHPKARVSHPRAAAETTSDQAKKTSPK